MGQYQKEVRRAAAKAFIHSLDQLEQTLVSSDSAMSEVAAQNANGDPKVNPAAPTTPERDWEEAVADIEQYMQHHEDDV